MFRTNPCFLLKEDKNWRINLFFTLFGSLQVKVTYFYIKTYGLWMGGYIPILILGSG